MNGELDIEGSTANPPEFKRLIPEDYWVSRIEWVEIYLDPSNIFFCIA